MNLSLAQQLADAISAERIARARTARARSRHIVLSALRRTRRQGGGR